VEDKLRQVFVDVFGISPEQFNDRLSKDDLSAWDSVTHVTLVLAIEEAFGVRLSPEEAEEMENVRLIKLTLAGREQQQRL